MEDRMMRTQHRLFTEATDAGFIGGTTVAVWFLLRDLLVGHPLRTPSVLGQVFLLGESHPDVHSILFGAVVAYTAVHFILFVLFAMLLAVLIRLAVDQPVCRFAILVLFVVYEFCFYVVVHAVSDDLGALFPLWTVLAANLLATAAMGAYFWRRYPEFGGILKAEPLGA
jgi:hypothetical protein